MYFISFPYSGGSNRFFLSERFIDFIYKNFDIDALDHCQFLIDKEEINLQDNAMEYYHDLMLQLKNLYTPIVINSNHSYNFNSSGDKVDLVRFPTLYYISISSILINSSVSQFLQSRSGIDLANDIWLVVLETSESARQSVQSISKQLEGLAPNLELDSQLFVIVPMEINCDNFNVYEAYKVKNLFLYLGMSLILNF